MSKPSIIYYDCLQYQPDNLARLHHYFDVTQIASPADDMPSSLEHANAVCAPLGYALDARKMDACPNLKVIVSNTTGVPHIDMMAAAERDIHVSALHNEQDFLQSITPDGRTHCWLDACLIASHNSGIGIRARWAVATSTVGCT